MASTVDIQIERSLTNTPTSLLYGEPAWDDANEKLYVGNSAGTPIIINPDPDVTLSDRYTFAVARNGNIASDQALRKTNGTFTNVNPFSVPYDGEIYCITAERENTNLTRTWDLVVEVNGSVVRTISVGTGQRDIQDDGLSISVSAGDDVAVFFRNASATINRPSGVVYGRRT